MSKRITVIVIISILAVSVAYVSGKYSALQNLKIEIVGFELIVQYARLGSAVIYLDFRIGNPSWLSIHIPTTDIEAFINDVYVTSTTIPSFTVGAHDYHHTRFSYEANNSCKRRFYLCIGTIEIKNIISSV